MSDTKDKLAGYYHEREHGLLPAPGVSDWVLRALGQLVGETTQSLREARRGLAPTGEGPAGPCQRSPGALPPRPLRRLSQPPHVGDWDEVGKLFRGA